MDRFRSASSSGYVSTIFGRRRYLPDIFSTDTNLRARSLRQAVNTIIQGSASDLIKHVMVSIDRITESHYSNGDLLKSSSLRPRMIMQIHDELIYEVPISEIKPSASNTSKANPIGMDANLQRFSSLLMNYMTMTVVQELELCIPLSANMSIGLDWGHLEEFSPISTVSIQSVGKRSID